MEDSEPEVIVFNPSNYGLKRKGGVPKAKAVLVSQPKTDFDAGEDIMDMEVSRLWEKLETTVDDLTISNARGRDRHQALVQKAIRLGAKPLPNPTKNVPFRIRKRMEAKQKERERKAKEVARERDTVMMRVGKEMKKRK